MLSLLSTLGLIRLQAVEEKSADSSIRDNTRHTLLCEYFVDIRTGHGVHPYVIDIGTIISGRQNTVF